MYLGLLDCNELIERCGVLIKDGFCEACMMPEIVLNIIMFNKKATQKCVAIVKALRK